MRAVVQATATSGASRPICSNASLRSVAFRGRLVFEPVDPGAGDLVATDEGERLPAGSPSAPSAFRLAGVGWATVELDRAEAELDLWLAPVADEARGQTHAQTTE